MINYNANNDVRRLLETIGRQAYEIDQVKLELEHHERVHNIVPQQALYRRLDEVIDAALRHAGDRYHESLKELFGRLLELHSGPEGLSYVQLQVIAAEYTS